MRGEAVKSKTRGITDTGCVCVSECVQLVEAMYVFLSDPRINAGTARREETGLSVGWDGIKGTSVESGGQG